MAALSGAQHFLTADGYTPARTFRKTDCFIFSSSSKCWLIPTAATQHDYNIAFMHERDVDAYRLYAVPFPPVDFDGQQQGVSSFILPDYLRPFFIAFSLLAAAAF